MCITNSLLFSMVHNLILFNLTVFCFTFHMFYLNTVKTAQLLNCTPHPFSQCQRILIYNQSCYDMCLSSISVLSSKTFNNHYLCDFISFANDDLC